MKNYLINGNFDIWQRGTSFTASGVYTADRWKQNHNTGAATYSRQNLTPGDIPGGPRYYMNVNVTSAAASTSNVIRQRIEGVRTLAGQQATLSFYAKANATKTFHVVISQNFGTGGSPSGGVQVMSTAQSIGTTWDCYTFTFDVDSISGMNIGTNGDDYLDFNIREGVSFSTFSLDIVQMQLEVGGAATPFEDRSLGEELSLAQRYYFKTFSQGTAPAQNAGRDGAAQIRAQGTSLSQSQFSLPVTMRVEPTITFYNPSAANAQIRNHSLATDFTSTSENSETHDRTIAFYGTPPASSTVLNGCSVHITADAEL